MKERLMEQFYDRAADGLPLLGRPAEAAERHRKAERAPAEAAEPLIRQYTALCGATGFVLGLPGYVTMPVTIPSNVAGVALLQLHMAAAIAVLGGRNPQDAAVRARCIGCVLGDAEAASERDEAEGLLGRLAAKVGGRGVQFASEQLARRAGRVAGRSVRSLPLVGGAVAGLLDVRSTRAAGRLAQRVFLENEDG